jgi:rubredoxin
MNKDSELAATTAQSTRQKDTNQFGDRLAYRKRIKVTEWKWQCSECGYIFERGTKPPKRCSNRGGCGRMLHDVPKRLERKAE